MYLSMVSNSDRVSLDKVGKASSFVSQHSRVWDVGNAGWLTPCEIMQGFQRSRMLEQEGAIDIFDLLTPTGQKLVVVTDGLLIGAQVGVGHVGKSSIDSFERIQILGQSDLCWSDVGIFSTCDQQRA